MTRSGWRQEVGRNRLPDGAVIPEETPEDVSVVPTLLQATRLRTKSNAVKNANFFFV